MSNNQFRGSRRRGYYIALGLCAVAIGVCGYWFARNSNTVENPPNQTVGGTLNGEDVPVVVTKPSQNTPTNQSTEPSGAAPTTGQKPLKTAYPLEGQTVAAYAMDALTYNQTTRDWRTHDGMDIGADAGTQVCAAADGVVYTVFEDDTMGSTVVIRHADGYVTQYASLDQEVPVTPGQTVTMGQCIGTVGTTALMECALGDHVHFSVTRDGKPMDPVEFLNMD